MDRNNTENIRRKREVRHISPMEYVIVICLVITALYLLLTSFFQLAYNFGTSFEPVNFLMNLFYFVLGLGTLAGAFLLFKKETHLEHIADDTFDEVIYKRLEPVLRDVADVQVGLTEIHDKLEMMNLNIEKFGMSKGSVSHEAVPLQSSLYMKYIVLINISLAAFLFILQYPLEYVPYAVTVLYILWWVVISAEFKLWQVDAIWLWVFIPIIILPVATIIMNAYLSDYQMFGSLFLILAVYVISYYAWCSNLVTGTLPFDLHIVLREFSSELKGKSPQEKGEKIPVSISRPEIKLPFKINPYQLGLSLIIASIALFTIAWLGYSIQHALLPNISWTTFGMDTFVWESTYSYFFTFVGILILVAGFIIILKFRGKNN